MISGTQQGRSDRVDALADRLASRRRVLFFGEMGTGKSTLAITLLRILAEQKCFCQFLELDPGSPPFGVPGTVSRAGWSNAGLICHDYQALCSLDAARFRLPLIQAARRLITGLEKKAVREISCLSILPALCEAWAVRNCLRPWRNYSRLIPSLPCIGKKRTSLLGRNLPHWRQRSFFNRLLRLQKP